MNLFQPFQALQKFLLHADHRHQGALTPTRTPAQPPPKASLQLLATSGPPDSTWTALNAPCETCGSIFMELYNYSEMWHDGDVYCHNGHWVRMYDAG
jgi:hypothetical protein